MNKKAVAAIVSLFLVLSLALSLLAAQSKQYSSGQNWTNYARIGAWGLHDKGDAERIVREAEASRVFGIEVDNDIPGSLRELSRSD